MTLKVVHVSGLHVVQSKRHPVDATHCSQDRFVLQNKAMITAVQAIVCSSTPAAV